MTVDEALGELEDSLYCPKIEFDSSFSGGASALQTIYCVGLSGPSRRF